MLVLVLVLVLVVGVVVGGAWGIEKVALAVSVAAVSPPHPQTSRRPRKTDFFFWSSAGRRWPLLTPILEIFLARAPLRYTLFSFVLGINSLTGAVRNIGENFCVGAAQLSAAYLLVRRFWAVFGPKTRDFGRRLAPVRRSTARNHVWSEVVGVFVKLAAKIGKFTKLSL